VKSSKKPISLIFLEKHRLAFLLALIVLIKFAVLASVPYLGNWDERFHALVAKNMISFPFKPMLKINPLYVKDYKAWCCNHIWLHKQPLFLWQMALSMKLLGANLLALRLPSILMTTLNALLVYDIARIWLKDKTIAFFSFILTGFSSYILLVSNGVMPTDHNDIAFGFYICASFWAFLKYTASVNKLGWIIVTGIFAGCAVLNKYLIICTMANIYKVQFSD